MTAEQLRKVHRTQPFRPFTLKLADGNKLHVPHPEFMWLLPGGRTVHVATGDDSFEIVDLLLVASLEVRDGAPREGG